MSETTRRDFLLQSAGALASAITPEPQIQSSRTRKTVGVQIGAVLFADEGIEPVLDILQEKVSVNTLFIAAFKYGRGIAVPRSRGQPLSDHGKQEYDTGTFHGGSYAAIHSEYYAETPLKNLRAPDLGAFDVFETVLPASRKRGMKNIAWFEDVFHSDIAGVEQLQERDLHGRNAPTLCLNNPGYRNFLLALVEDYTRSWELDGIMWGSERQAAFANALGSHHGAGRKIRGV